MAMKGNRSFFTKICFLLLFPIWSTDLRERNSKQSSIVKNLGWELRDLGTIFPDKDLWKFSEIGNYGNGILNSSVILKLENLVTVVNNIFRFLFFAIVEKVFLGKLYYG